MVIRLSLGGIVTTSMLMADDLSRHVGNCWSEDRQRLYSDCQSKLWKLLCESQFHKQFILTDQLKAPSNNIFYDMT